MLMRIFALAAGFGLDLLAGDPSWIPHPVRLMGTLIAKGEKLIRRVFPDSVRGQLAGGTVLALLVMTVSFAIPLAVLFAAARVHYLLAFILESFMCFQILAVKSLKKESMKVYQELAKGDLERARYMVSMIVGRDTENLSPSQIAKAAVETVAENTSDGVIAPMIYIAIGGAPLGFLYKSINTMDSMIGYKNDKYLYFGRFAAKLDDFVNFLPARIAAFVMIAASAVLKMDYKNAFRIFKRDRFCHASPNSAQTEAVCAGALQVQLAGDAWYFGTCYEKETIGDDIRPVEFTDIKQANSLLYGTAWIALLICLLGMGAWIWLI